jgi:hypothetical protein
MAYRAMTILPGRSVVVVRTAYIRAVHTRSLWLRVPGCVSRLRYIVKLVMCDGAMAGDLVLLSGYFGWCDGAKIASAHEP